MAKAKSNKISINALEKVAKEFQNEVTFEWQGLQVTVKHVLSLEEFVDFVRSVVRCCFSEETGEYMPEARDVCIRSNILDHYANFTMPKNSATQFDLVWKTDAVDVVLDRVNEEQFKELLRCIDKQIAYLVETDMSRLRKDVETVVRSWSNVIEKYDSAYGDVSEAELKNMLSALASGSLDEEKLARAVVDARRLSGEDGQVVPIRAGTAMI